MSSGIYHSFLSGILKEEHDLDNDTIKVALLDNNHAFSGGDDVWGDISSNEISGSGYTAGGETLTNQGVTEGVTTKFDADNVIWSDATFSAYHAVLYNSSNTDKLIASIDFGGEQAISDGNFEIAWDSAGIITISE